MRWFLQGPTFFSEKSVVVGEEQLARAPQSAMLGIGRIVKKTVVVVEDQTSIRPTVTLTLVFDHRAMDGAKAAQFLQSLKRILEDPSSNLE